MLGSPRRIAVVVLAAAVGFALDRLFGWSDALVIGLVVGLLIAAFVPARGACPLPEPRDPRDRTT